MSGLEKDRLPDELLEGGGELKDLDEPDELVEGFGVEVEDLGVEVDGLGVDALGADVLGEENDRLPELKLDLELEKLRLEPAAKTGPASTLTEKTSVSTRVSTRLTQVQARMASHPQRSSYLRENSGRIFGIPAGLA